MQKALKAAKVSTGAVCEAEICGGKVFFKEGTKCFGDTIQMHVYLKVSSGNQCLAQAGD